MTQKALLLLTVALIVLLAACQPNQTLSRGGQLYDKWWVVAETEPPESDQPLWTTQSTNERSGSDTWRCKECHGWDYLGTDGAYGSGSHFTGFMGVLNAKDKTEKEIVAILSGETNPDHNFSTVLTADELKTLANFVREGMLDLRPFIAADKSVKGDAQKGKRLYDNCVACHGDNGNEMNTEDSDDEPVNLGRLANDNPWEVFHKASFGQPGVSNMTVGVTLNWTAQDVADLLSYLQTLSQE
jgi:hypothetical protein